MPVELWIKPRINFTLSDQYFGCDGDISTKPRAVGYYNPFVLRGKIKKGSPETDPEHYVDHWLYYHIREERRLIDTEVYVWGFIIETREPGRYAANMFFHGEKLGKATLVINVEDEPKTEMKCLAHDNCYIRPKKMSKA